MTKKSKMTLALASMLGITAGATAVSGFAWFTTTKSATVDVTNIGVYSKSSALDIAFVNDVNNKNCDGDVSSSTLTVQAQGAEVVETFSGDGSEKSFTLKQTPYDEDEIDIEVGGVANDAWSISGKTITFTAAPASGANNIEVTYNPREVLTDVSSIDGQNIYKPTWTASGEGQFATAMPAATEGFLRFTMRLTASGASDLEVFLNSPSITGLGTGNTTANDAAADIARVAVIDNGTTRFVLQNDYDPEHPAMNLGIGPSNVSTPNWECDAEHVGLDGWDLSLASSTTAVPTLTPTGSASKDNLSTAPAHTATADIIANNYVCHVDAGDHKDIQVVVWLEGTNYNDGNHAYGAYATNILEGVFSVQLPLIAF